MTLDVLLLHGIDHGMFGKRDPEQYGTTTLAQIERACSCAAVKQDQKGLNAVARIDGNSSVVIGHRFVMEAH